MEPFADEIDLLDQEREAEAEIARHDEKYWDEGKCRACLEDNQALDDNGFCDKHAGYSPDARAALIDLLNQ